MAAQRSHKATYARDKKNGGYLIRVQGPQAGKFQGKTVPVTRQDGSETDVELEALIWRGMSEGTDTDDYKGPVALYGFTAKPREDAEDVVF